LGVGVSTERGVRMKERAEDELRNTGGRYFLEHSLIENETDIRTLLKDALEWGGYHVYTASNGKEGMEILHGLPASCLIAFDLMMPVMNLVTWWQFTDDRADAGRIVVIVFALLLLAGGISLVARSVIDLVWNRKSSKRSDVHRKKAA
jgi:hypothetical protein